MGAVWETPAAGERDGEANGNDWDSRSTLNVATWSVSSSRTEWVRASWSPLPADSVRPAPSRSIAVPRVNLTSTNSRPSSAYTSRQLARRVSKSKLRVVAAAVQLPALVAVDVDGQRRVQAGNRACEPGDPSSSTPATLANNMTDVASRSLATTSGCDDTDHAHVISMTSVDAPARLACVRYLTRNTELLATSSASRADQRLTQAFHGSFLIWLPRSVRDQTLNNSFTSQTRRLRLISFYAIAEKPTTVWRCVCFLMNETLISNRHERRRLARLFCAALRQVTWQEMKTCASTGLLPATAARCRTRRAALVRR